EPARGGDGSLGDRQRPGAGKGARLGSLRPRRRSVRRCGRGLAVPSGDRAADPRSPAATAGPVARPRAAARRRGGDRYRARFAALPTGRRPHRGCVIDTHAHLDACAEPAPVVVERARVAGVRTILAVGTTIAGCRAALAIADGAEGVFAVLG